MLFAALLASASMTAAAPPQDAPEAWRRYDMSPTVPAAVAFTDEVDGVRRATVILRPSGPRPSGPDGFRGLAMETEVWCGRRAWRIVAATYYADDDSVVRRDGAVPEAPLVRQTPLHAAITDICDGAHTGPVGLTTTDPLAVLRWLAGN